MTSWARDDESKSRSKSRSKVTYALILLDPSSEEPYLLLFLHLTACQRLVGTCLILVQ